MADVSALLPMYGSDRMQYPRYLEALGKISWLGIPYLGGTGIVAAADVKTIVGCDLHSDIINVWQITNDPALVKQLVELLDGPFHEQYVLQSQKALNASFDLAKATLEERMQRAAAYFRLAWMGRNGVAGTKAEAKASMSVRFSGGGGDSAKRFRSAVSALQTFGDSLKTKNASFLVRNTTDFLKDLQTEKRDREVSGLYVDAPWPVGGKQYRYGFDAEMFKTVAEQLAGFKRMRIVVRCSDDPVTRAAYPEENWHYTIFDSRSQTNGAVSEVMIQPKRQLES